MTSFFIRSSSGIFKAPQLVTTKVILLVIALFCLTLSTKAQMGNEYAKFDIGASIGANQFYGDVATLKSTQEVSLNLNYNQTPFINYILEGQLGKLAGGSTNDHLGKKFATNYQYVDLRIQLQAGEIIDYSNSGVANALKNLYVGTGIGVIFGKVTSINRYSTKFPGDYFPGDNKSKQAFLPIRIGYEFKLFNEFLQPYLKIDIGYQYHYIYGDEIDGYRSGHVNDSFSQFTIGGKFSIGALSSYRKQVYNFH